MALLLQNSPSIDEELARVVRSARGGGAYSRYRIFVDDERHLNTDTTPEPQQPDSAVRALPNLGSKPLRWLIELAFRAITEMVTLDLRRWNDAGPPPGAAGVIRSGQSAENRGAAYLDRDLDELTDAFERLAGINPYAADVDGDGLSDLYPSSSVSFSRS